MNKAEFAFYQIQNFEHVKKDIPFLQKKIIPALQYSISLALIVYHFSIEKSIYIENKLCHSSKSKKKLTLFNSL